MGRRSICLKIVVPVQTKRNHPRQWEGEIKETLIPRVNIALDEKQSGEFDSPQNFVSVKKKKEKKKIEKRLNPTARVRTLKYPGYNPVPELVSKRHEPCFRSRRAERIVWSERSSRRTRFVAADSARLKEPYEVYLAARGKPVDFCHIVGVDVESTVGGDLLRACSFVAAPVSPLRGDGSPAGNPGNWIFPPVTIDTDI